MGACGRRNLKRKRMRKEATVSASSEGADHVDDLMKRNSKKHELSATKPTAHEEEEAQPAGAGKTKEKRRRVVRERLPEKLIHIMIIHSCSVHEIPGERLARLNEEFRASYAESKAKSEKMQADQQALIDQYLINGYVEEEREITNDEDDGDGTAEIDGSKGG